MVKKEDVQNDNDKLVMVIGLVFDLEFKESFKYLKDFNILEGIKEVYNKEMFTEYFVILKEFIDEKCKEK